MASIYVRWMEQQLKANECLGVEARKAWNDLVDAGCDRERLCEFVLTMYGGRFGQLSQRKAEDMRENLRRAAKDLVTLSESDLANSLDPRWDWAQAHATLLHYEEMITVMIASTAISKRRRLYFDDAYHAFASYVQAKVRHRKHDREVGVLAGLARGLDQPLAARQRRVRRQTRL
jgi:hypothetical protein